MTYIIKGIILKSRLWRDYDLFCTVYSAELGKFDALLKGGRRAKSKLRSGLEVLNQSELMIARGLNWRRLAGCQILHSWPRLRADYDRLIYALVLAEVVDSLTEEESPDSGIYQILSDWFSYLDTSRSNNNLSLLVLLVIWQLLKHAGYGPLLTNCLRCNQEIGLADHYFSVREGGLVCRVCLKQEEDYDLSPEVVKLIRFWFQQEDLLTACRIFAKIVIDRKLTAEMDGILRKFIFQILEKEPRTFSFFSKLD